MFWLGAPLAAALLTLTLPLAWLCGSLALLVAVLVLAYRFGWNGAPLLLEPTTGSGPELAVIVIQGEGIPAERYVPVGAAIQRHCASRRLWVAIPRFLGDSPTPREMPLVVAKARRALAQRGLPARHPLPVRRPLGGGHRRSEMAHGLS